MDIKKHSNIEEAKDKLKKAKNKIDKRHESSKEDEPDILVSGYLDEVELKRRDKQGDKNE